MLGSLVGPDRDRAVGGLRRRAWLDRWMSSPDAARTIPRWIWLAILLLVAAGLAGFWLAAVVGDGSTGPIVSGHSAVEGLIPARDSEVLQQQPVGIDLSAPYELISLVIHPNSSSTGGVEVISETRHVDGLNQFLFRPGPDRLIDALSPDTNCAVATFALTARRDDIATAKWCFEVS